MVASLDDVIDKYDTWRRLLPRVQPHYAVKCNDSPMVIDCLARMGCRFDCASKVEIQKVLNHGVKPDHIVYAHATKQSSHISYARSVRVYLMSADNRDELYKIARLYPSARVLIRVAPQTRGSVQIDLSAKFGCSRAHAIELICLAHSLSLHVHGLSIHVGSGIHDIWTMSRAVRIHVGSGIRDIWTMPRAVRYMSEIFDAAAAIGVRTMSMLDIGGGFPGHTEDRGLFVRIAEKLSRSLSLYFPPSRHVTLIAEPGRYFVTSAFTLYTPVIGVRSASEISDDYVNCNTVYYLSEGFFGCFNGIVTEDSPVLPESFKDGVRKMCDLRGPTWHPDDVILKQARLPTLEPNDWLRFGDCGAYTTSISMGLNGVSLPTVYWTISQQACSRLLNGYCVRLTEKDHIRKEIPVYERNHVNDVTNTPNVTPRILSALYAPE